MTGPLWIRVAFAAVLVAVAGYCVARLVAARRGVCAGGCGTDRSADVSHGVMSLGMAAMFVPAVDPVPRLGWQVVFAFIACWFAVRLIRRRGAKTQETHHVVGSLAMVYMFSAMPAAGMSMDMPGMSMGGGVALPVLAWLFLAYVLVYVVGLGARLIETPHPAQDSGIVVSPQLLGSCRVVMGVGMGYMLVAML